MSYNCISGLQQVLFIELNVSKLSRPSSILGVKSTYPSEPSVHTNMYRSGYMLQRQRQQMV